MGERRVEDSSRYNSLPCAKWVVFRFRRLGREGDSRGSRLGGMKSSNCAQEVKEKKVMFLFF